MNRKGQFASDLVALAADDTIASVVEVLLSRHASLAIRPIGFDVFAHPDHDPGCLCYTADFLRRFLATHARAIVVFDRIGSGRESLSAPELEQQVSGDLRRSGCGDRAEAIVIDPELEVWAWSDSPRVEHALGWATNGPRLRRWLEQRGLWCPERAKPDDPKAALTQVLLRTRVGPARLALAQLAQTVGLRRCTDRAFLRFREILQRWFPAS